VFLFFPRRAREEFHFNLFVPRTWEAPARRGRQVGSTSMRPLPRNDIAEIRTAPFPAASCPMPCALGVGSSTWISTRERIPRRRTDGSFLRRRPTVSIDARRVYSAKNAMQGSTLRQPQTDEDRDCGGARGRPAGRRCGTARRNASGTAARSEGAKISISSSCPSHIGSHAVCVGSWIVHIDLASYRQEFLWR